MRFFRYLFILLFAAVAIHVVVAMVADKYPLFGWLWWWNIGSLLFLASKTAGAYTLTIRNLDLSPWKFVNVVSGVMLLKLLLSIGWVIIMVFVVNVDPFGFTLPYFGGYILFTGFEITALLNNLRPNSQKSRE